MSSVIIKIINDLKDREQKGIEKYGTDLDRQDLTQAQWIQHLYEELLDAACYLQNIKPKESIEDSLKGVHEEAALKFGKLAVMQKLVEEMSELSAEIMQSLNKDLSYNDSLSKIIKINEELADVIIVAMQLRKLLGAKNVDGFIELKIDRLKTML